MLLLSSSLMLVPANFAKAQEPAGAYLEPRVYDFEAVAGDVIEENVRIKNNSDKWVELTPIVFDLTARLDSIGSATPDSVEKSLLLAAWVNFYRGVIRLAPQEEIIKPLKIKVSNKAGTGTYYAYIVLSEGKNFPNPGSISPPYSQLALLLRVDLGKNIVESAQLEDFSSSKNIFLELPADFSYSLKNIGNETISPEGSLRIYNRAGEEIEEFKIKMDNLSSGETRLLKQSWNPVSGFGKYKARLMLEYGGSSKRDIQEIIFFWILPLKLLAIFISVTLLVFILFIAALIKRSRKRILK